MSVSERIAQVSLQCALGKGRQLERHGAIFSLTDIVVPTYCLAPFLSTLTQITNLLRASLEMNGEVNLEVIPCRFP